MPVHFGGIPADIKKIQELSDSKIIIIEDHSEIGGLASAVSEYYIENKNLNNFLKS